MTTALPGSTDQGRTTVTARTPAWYPLGTEGLQAELHDGCHAEIFPGLSGWAWRIYRGGTAGVTDRGTADGEADARLAVADWAELDLLAAEITEGVLSEAVSVFSWSLSAFLHATAAIAATSAIADEIPVSRLRLTAAAGASGEGA
jgi:hypothetical protein